MIGIKMLHGETRSLEIGNTFRIAANVLRFRQGYFCRSRHDNCRLIKPITSRPSSEVTNLSRRILVYQGEAPHMQEIEMPKDNDALSF